MTKLLLLGDIYANYPALNAILRRIEADRFDRIVNTFLSIQAVWGVCSMEIQGHLLQFLSLHRRKYQWNIFEFPIRWRRLLRV